MKLNLVSTAPPRWFLFDDFGTELAQRADVAFYDTAVITTPKGKSVVNTLLKMEAERLGVASVEEQEAAGATVTIVKVEPHEHPDYLRSMPIHDHPEYVYEHDLFATVESLQRVSRDLARVELGQTTAQESINRRIDQHEAGHSYAPLNHPHAALEQRLASLENLVEALIKKVDAHTHTGFAAEVHSHEELAAVNEALRAVRHDMGAQDIRLDGIESKADALAVHPDYATAAELANHLHRQYALGNQLQEHLDEAEGTREVDVVSFKDIGGNRKRYVVQDRSP